MSDEWVVINERVRIPISELSFQFARASGPGGQHVNRTESAVELTFDLAHSILLTGDERARASTKLGPAYIDADGILRVVAQSERSQLRNRELAIARFAELLRQALIVPKKRRPTKPSKASQEKRMDRKRKTGQTKRGRGKVSVD